MSKTQIKELAQTRRLTQDIYFTGAGHQFRPGPERLPGAKISKGEELYKLADLSHVWIVADLYENEAPLSSREPKCGRPSLSGYQPSGPR